MAEACTFIYDRGKRVQVRSEDKSGARRVGLFNSTKRSDLEGGEL